MRISNMQKSILYTILTSLTLCMSISFGQTFIQKTKYKKEPVNKYGKYLHQVFTRAWHCAEPPRNLFIVTYLYPDGHLENAAIKESIGDAAIEQCAIGAIQSLSSLKKPPKAYFSQRQRIKVEFVRLTDGNSLIGLGTGP